MNAWLIWDLQTFKAKSKPWALVCGLALFCSCIAMRRGTLSAVMFRWMVCVKVTSLTLHIMPRGWILHFGWSINQQLSACNIKPKRWYHVVIVFTACFMLPQCGHKINYCRYNSTKIPLYHKRVAQYLQYVPCLSGKQEVISLIHSQFDKMGRKIPVLTETHWSRDESSFCLSSSQPLPGWPDTACCASRSITAADHSPWGSVFWLNHTLCVLCSLIFALKLFPCVHMQVLVDLSLMTKYTRKVPHNLNTACDIEMWNKIICSSTLFIRC